MLAQRILTGVLLGGLVVAAVLWLRPVAAGIVLGLLWLLGVREWAGFASLGRAASASYVAAAAVFMAGASWAIADRVLVQIVLAVAIVWWLVAIAALKRHPRPVSMRSTAAAGFATLLPAWVLFASLYSETGRGPAWVLTVLAIVWSADIGAYAIGRWLGRTKLAPTISPGKTWEGVGAGVACASIAGWLASTVLRVPALELAVLAALTAAGSVVGDLTVSLFKRNAGLKDSGRLLPGHGGVLDRIDSLTAAVAVFVLGLSVTGIITSP